MKNIVIATALFLFSTVSIFGQVIVSPSNVNAYSQGATTVYLTFGNVINLRPAEAVWCGEIISAAPDVGFKCDPNTIFGQLPNRYNQSRLSGNKGYTDIMSITPSVARRAYLDAVRGNNSQFFYVKHFVSTNGGADEYVPVTIRLSGNGAGVPFSLTGVKLLWEDGTKVVPFIKPSEKLPKISAEIRYTGTGILKGRWEIVNPGETLPEPRDLLSEAALPPEERGTQRRYTELSRFNITLPPGGKFILDGPKDWRIDKTIEGMYLLLLRIEAGDASDSASDLSATGTGTGRISTGAVAGFSMPTLRYYVGNNESDFLKSQNQIGDSDTQNLPTVLRWKEIPNANFYRVEIRSDTNEEIFNAIVSSDKREYQLPSFIQVLTKSKQLKWRVVGLDEKNKVIASSEFLQVIEN